MRRDVGFDLGRPEMALPEEDAHIAAELLRERAAERFPDGGVPVRLQGDPVLHQNAAQRFVVRLHDADGVEQRTPGGIGVHPVGALPQPVGIALVVERHRQRKIQVVFAGGGVEMRVFVLGHFSPPSRPAL